MQMPLGQSNDLYDLYHCAGWSDVTTLDGHLLHVIKQSDSLEC